MSVAGERITSLACLRLSRSDHKSNRTTLIGQACVSLSVVMEVGHGSILDEVSTVTR